MIPTLLASMLALVTGALLGGCVGRDDEITSELIERNAQLQNQAHSSQDVITAMAVTLVILASGLAVALVAHKRKGSNWRKTKQ